MGKTRLWNLSRTSLFIRGALLLVLLSFVATPALAHRVVIFAFAEGDTVQTESKFMPGGPVKQGKIIVQDPKTGKELLTGQTDDQGKFSFPMPPEAKSQKMDLKIIVEAGMGHRAEFLLKAK